MQKVNAVSVFHTGSTSGLKATNKESSRHLIKSLYYFRAIVRAARLYSIRTTDIRILAACYEVEQIHHTIDLEMVKSFKVEQGMRFYIAINSLKKRGLLYQVGKSLMIRETGLQLIKMVTAEAEKETKQAFDNINRIQSSTSNSPE